MKGFLRSIGWMMVVTMTTLGLLANSVWGQEQEVIGGGRYLYEEFCKSCHGPRAMGDGPQGLALFPKPANLTILRQRNEGTFPFWQTYRMIDGREEVLNHGTREMPVFGM